jgi:hypothetical protein
MNMDNKLFNINGKTKEQLEKAINLLLLDEYGNDNKVAGWYINIDKGLVLTWYVGPEYNAKAFTDNMGNPRKITGKELVEILWNWLNSEDSKTIKLGKWETNADHDGDNDLGWRLYTEDWGCINTKHSIDHYSIAAFKPVYLWYGK